MATSSLASESAAKFNARVIPFVIPADSDSASDNALVEVDSPVLAVDCDIVAFGNRKVRIFWFSQLVKMDYCISKISFSKLQHFCFVLSVTVVLIDE
jgi:hypothetical protein